MAAYNSHLNSSHRPISYPWQVKGEQIRFCKDEKNVNIVLGAGAFGEVLKAKYDANAFVDDEKEADNVALKWFEASEENLKELQKEATALSQQHHDNIVFFYGIFFEPGKLYFVMELMEGSLSEVTHMPTDPYYTVWREDPRLFFNVILSIVKGMEAMHKRKIAHRDMKPGNVLHSEDFHIKITDFGQSHVSQQTIEDESSVDITSSTPEKMFMVGTPPYMAPELVQIGNGGKAPDPYAADVYSFGITLWEMCAQQEPYKDINFQTTYEMLKNIKDNNWRPDHGNDNSTSLLDHKQSSSDSSVGDQIPKKLLMLIKWCWDKDPEKRPTFAKIKDYIKRRGQRELLFCFGDPNTQLSSRRLSLFDHDVGENVPRSRSLTTPETTKRKAAYLKAENSKF